jgi:hypothetical protein
MWQQYKKTFFRTQAFILVVCALAVWALHLHPVAVLATFLVMQGFAFMGAAWGANLTHRMREHEERQRQSQR